MGASNFAAVAFLSSESVVSGRFIVFPLESSHSIGKKNDLKFQSKNFPD